MELARDEHADARGSRCCRAIDCSGLRGQVRARRPSAIAFDTLRQWKTVLVFTYGWACDRSLWREPAEVFARSCRVVTRDLTERGPFFSDLAAGVCAGFVGLGLRRVILVGHSMGGLVALSAARRLPGIVRGVVLVDTLHDPSTRVTPEMTADIVRDLQADFAGAIEKMVRTQFVPGVNDKARDWVIERARKADPATARKLLRDYPNINFGMLLTDAGAGLPVRAINVSATKIDVVRSFAPDFDAVIMPGVGHFPHLERPAEFNETLRAVLAGFK